MGGDVMFSLKSAVEQEFKWQLPFITELEGVIASDLLALDLSHPETIEFAVDIRDSAIHWINDIEKDAKYRSWPSTCYELLRPAFPGMVRSVRKNLFNVVVVIDPLIPDVRGITKLVESFVVHSAPIRCGIVFDTRRTDATSQKAYRALNAAWNYISQVKKTRDALSFLTDVSRAFFVLFLLLIYWQYFWIIQKFLIFLLFLPFLM